MWKENLKTMREKKKKNLCVTFYDVWNRTSTVLGLLSLIILEVKLDETCVPFLNQRVNIFSFPFYRIKCTFFSFFFSFTVSSIKREERKKKKFSYTQDREKCSFWKSKLEERKSGEEEFCSFQWMRKRKFPSFNASLFLSSSTKSNKPQSSRYLFYIWSSVPTLLLWVIEAVKWNEFPRICNSTHFRFNWQLNLNWQKEEAKKERESKSEFKLSSFSSFSFFPL